MATAYLAYDLGINCINPATVDTATCQNPFSYPVGIVAVVVNGPSRCGRGSGGSGGLGGG
jgi:hypothetical protein